MNFYDLDKEVQESMLVQLKNEVKSLISEGVIEISFNGTFDKTVNELAEIMAENMSFTKEEFDTLNDVFSYKVSNL